MLEGLHHMQLAMSEIEKPPVLAARGGAWFRAGGLELHLGVEDDFRPARKGPPGSLVNDLDEVVRRLGEPDQNVTGDGDLPGFRRVHAHDPIGNRWEFLQPAWPSARRSSPLVARTVGHGRLSGRSARGDRAGR